MQKYFAKLDGDTAGIDAYCSFTADGPEVAQSIADDYAELNYSEYDEPFDEAGDPLFYASVEIWDDEKHGEYVGDACFKEHI